MGYELCINMSPQTKRINRFHHHHPTLVLIQFSDCLAKKAPTGAQDIQIFVHPSIRFKLVWSSQFSSLMFLNWLLHCSIEVIQSEPKIFCPFKSFLWSLMIFIIHLKKICWCFFPLIWPSWQSGRHPRHARRDPCQHAGAGASLRSPTPARALNPSRCFGESCRRNPQ